VPPGAAALRDALAREAAAPLRLDAGGAARLDAALELNLEAYAHTNPGDFYNEEDWIYGFVSRKPLARAALEASLGSWFYVTSDVEYAWNFGDGAADVTADLAAYPGGVGAAVPAGGGANDAADYAQTRVWSRAYSDAFTLNIPPHTSDMECVFPKRAFLSFGGQSWNLSFGRDRLQWGRGHTGSLVLDGGRDFDNFIRFTAGSGAFRYELLTTIYDKYDYDGTGVEKSRYYLLHRLEFRVLPTLTFALSENIMYQDEFFDIRYLNPAFIYHNWDETGRFNALAHAEADWAVAPGWNVYAQYALDQGRAPNESDAEADAWGVLAGVERGRVIALGGAPALLTCSLEGAYTSPLLYRRDRVDFLVLNRRVSFNLGSLYSLEYVGYPWGGDTAALQADAALSVPGRWEASARLFGMIHGAMTFFQSHNAAGDNAGRANVTGSTPSGDAADHETVVAVTLRGSYAVPLPRAFPALTVWAEADYIGTWNKLAYGVDPAAGAPVYVNRPGFAGDLQVALGVGCVF